MPTPINGLTGQTTTEADDYLVIENFAANRTRKIKYSDFKNELSNDMDIVTTAELNAAIAAVTAAYQAADLVKLQLVFQVGSKITLLGANAFVNPSTYLGFGTWTLEQGKYYVGFKTGDAIFGGLGTTVGSNTHNHGGAVGSTVLNGTQIPSHSHGYKDTFLTENSSLNTSTPSLGEYTEFRGQTSTGTDGSDTDNDMFFYKNRITDVFGGTQGHNHTVSSDSNIPLSIVEAVWRRTA